MEPQQPVGATDRHKPSGYWCRACHRILGETEARHIMLLMEGDRVTKEDPHA